MSTKRLNEAHAENPAPKNPAISAEILNLSLQTRSLDNPHLARHLRQRLERRAGADSAMRRTLDGLTDAALIAQWHHNHMIGVAYAELNKATADLPKAQRRILWIGLLGEIVRATNSLIESETP